MTEKICSECEDSKPLKDFYINKNSEDGRVKKCRECTKAGVRANRAKNIEYYRKYDRDRSMRPDRVQARQEYQKTKQGLEAGNRGKKAWDERNPIKKGASTIVGNAIRRGDLLKPDICDECKLTNERIHGHHDDYALPLVVRWLCPGCHSAWHKENGSGANAE